MNEGSRLLARVMMITTALYILGGMLVVYWLVVPYRDPVEFPNAPYPVLNCPCEPGGEVLYEVISDSNRIITSDIQVVLVDGVFRVIDQFSAANIDGVITHTASKVLPDNIPPGEYHIEVQFTYQANPIRTEVFKARTQTFLVVEGDK